MKTKLINLWSELKWKIEDNKRSIIFVTIIILCTFIGGCTWGVDIGMQGMVTQESYDSANELIAQKEKQITKYEKNIENLEKDKSELQEKIDLAKDYYSLNKDEKEIVDHKIVEVKQATEEKLAQEKAQKEAEEKAKKEKEEEARRQAEAQQYETGLTWEQIAREGRFGEKGKFEGKIIQVMNGEGFTQYRVAINSNYDNIMLVEVVDGISKEVLLEDDYVYFKGISLGQYTYTTVLGAKVTIPAFSVSEITR